MNPPPLSDLPLSSDDQKLLDLLNEEPASPARHCFRSALEHLRRAMLIQDLDPAMAVFRGITAEEEAATGLMHAFKSRQYPNADLLKPRNHVQKHAVTPFLRFLLTHLSEIKLNGVKSIRLALKDIEGRKRLVVAFLLEGDGEPLVATPTPPLNLSMREGNDPGFPDLSRNIRGLLEPTGYTNVLNFLKAEANLRNRILYAGPNGYPVLSDLSPEYLRDRQRRVMAILKVTLLVLPYDEVQPFAAEALDSFLRLVNRLDQQPLHDET
jgi:hypothetical protein